MSTSALAPSSSAVGRLAETVREANDARRPLRITGAGTWKGAPQADATLELPMRHLDQVVEYVPGDLTITVGAGASLAAIETLTAQHGQWLTLDPYGSTEGTIGATIATASSGPLATGFGTPRDIIIGLEAVMGTGSIVRAGGRVVKNVAGFDVTRLLTGSRGTIGAITEVSLRLRARPAHDETLAIILGSKASLRDLFTTLRGWPTMPMAAELVTPRTAAALGLREGTTLLLRFGGNRRLLGAMTKRASGVGQVTPVDADVWTRLRALDLEATVSFRLSDLPAAFSERWDDALALAADGGHVVGSILRGQVRCMMPSIDRARITAFRGRAPQATLLYDSLPGDAVWNALTSVPAASTLHARIIDAFDPVGVMNPGSMRLAR
jgi:FAD/FMN-containing dehydrogenase